MLLRLGGKRLGLPSPSVASTIAAIDSVERLEQLAERLLEAESWDELSRLAGAGLSVEHVRGWGVLVRADLPYEDSSSAPFTPREAEVLALLAQGRTNKQIGAELYISEKTASVHVSNILAKLEASGRTEAVAIAAQRGLLPTA